MINLIPTEEKKRKNKVFYFRLAIVFIWSLGSSIFIASIVLIPSYFASSLKKNIANTKLETQKNEVIPVLDQEALSTIKSLNAKLNLIESAQKNEFLVSANVINEIVSKKLPTIKITQILYDNSPEKNKTISIRGSAPSREQLLLFREALENDAAFLKVDLPISNFVKGSDIQFYLNLIPRPNGNLGGQTL